MTDEPLPFADGRLTRRQAVAAGGAVTLGLSLAACGAGSSHSSSAATSAAGTPKRGGSLRVAVEGNGLKDIMDAQNDLAKIDQARLVTGWEPLLEYDRDFKLAMTGLAESVEPTASSPTTSASARALSFTTARPSPPTMSFIRSSA